MRPCAISCDLVRPLCIVDTRRAAAVLPLWGCCGTAACPPRDRRVNRRAWQGAARVERRGSARLDIGPGAHKNLTLTLTLNLLSVIHDLLCKVIPVLKVQGRPACVADMWRA
eukprot:2030482-Prymnesium_polylepis.1